MNKISELILFFLCVFLTACEAEKKQPQLIVPQGQLDALDKAKNLENELLQIQQQKEKQLQQQGL